MKYRVKRIRDLSEEGLDKLLNSIDKDGYDLFGFQDHLFIFKKRTREKKKTIVKKNAKK